MRNTDQLQGAEVWGRPNVCQFLPSFIQQMCISFYEESGSVLGAGKDTSHRGSALRNLKKSGRGEKTPAATQAKQQRISW